MFIFKENLNIDTSYVYQMNIPKFSKKISQKFFANISFKGLSPLIGCQNVIYGGDTGGGRGSLCHKGIGGRGYKDPIDKCELIVYYCNMFTMLFLVIGLISLMFWGMVIMSVLILKYGKKDGYLYRWVNRNIITDKDLEQS